MVSLDEYQQRVQRNASMGVSVSTGFVSQEFVASTRGNYMSSGAGRAPIPQGIPQLLLYNDSLNIRMQGINGAVIGRRQGPYTQFFQQNMYVSGVHAQLKYNPGTGWCVTDKHSSDGTSLNQRKIQPDVDMSLNNGDILTIANVNLQVTIR
jgi:pSer/pThr/pTyr-binding forkhead associated (FHA) protein